MNTYDLNSGVFLDDKAGRFTIVPVGSAPEYFEVRCYLPTGSPWTQRFDRIQVLQWLKCFFGHNDETQFNQILKRLEEKAEFIRNSAAAPN